MTTASLPDLPEAPAWSIRPEQPLDLDQIHDLHRDAFRDDAAGDAPCASNEAAGEADAVAAAATFVRASALALGWIEAEAEEVASGEALGVALTLAPKVTIGEAVGEAPTASGVSSAPFPPVASATPARTRRPPTARVMPRIGAVDAHDGLPMLLGVPRVCGLHQ